MTLEPRYPAAKWAGPIPNKTKAGVVRPPLGLVLHVEEGTEGGTSSWFHNPAAQASAHFGAGPAAADLSPVPLDQWVELDDRAWAEVAGNSRWISVETAGHSSEPMDHNQLLQIAQLYAWLHEHAGVPFHTSESPTEPGFGWHGMGGEAWGGHFDCPGEHRKSQRLVILAKAMTLVHPHPAHTPKQSDNETTPAYPGHVLELGSTGHAVKQLTNHLRARGWGLAETEHFDEHVAKVVAEFQAEKHLRVDRKVGPVTWYAVWHLPVTS